MTTTTPTTSTKVHLFDEGEVLVRGVETVEDARAVAAASDEVVSRWAHEEGVLNLPIDYTEADVTALARAYAGSLVAKRAGWFRINVGCRCGDDHSWHLAFVDGPGRGNFHGVLLTHGGAA